jgi:hypothetical protein
VSGQFGGYLTYGEVRVIFDSGNVYAWDAALKDHTQVAGLIGLPMGLGLDKEWNFSQQELERFGYDLQNHWANE